MDVNPWVALYIAASLFCMGSMLYLAVRQFGEVRRPKNNFTKLRWRLFWLPTFIFLSIALGFPRLLENLHLAIDEAGQTIRIVSGVLTLVGFTALVLSIYTFKERE